jgi:hypothetical protein
MDIILVIGVLLIGYALYILISNKLKALEQKITVLESDSKLHRDAIIKMNNHINELTNSHNHIADILNTQHDSEPEMVWGDYSPFNTPKGEA